MTSPIANNTAYRRTGRDCSSLGVLPARPLAAVPALLLVMISLWEIWATRHDAGAVPGDDAWDSATVSVRNQYRRGDLIVFAPDWVDPVGRLHLGDLIG